MSDAPCKICGYNGPGFYQPNTHPCLSNNNYTRPQPTASVDAEPVAWMREGPNTGLRVFFDTDPTRAGPATPLYTEAQMQAAFADGFTAALQGAEAVIWRIEDDSFLYEDVSKALQEVISELQAMEQNWTGRATIEHRQAAIKERDAEIVAWLRVREEDYRMSGQGGYATVLDLAATAIERGEV